MELNTPATAWTNKVKCVVREFVGGGVLIEPYPSREGEGVWLPHGAKPVAEINERPKPSLTPEQEEKSFHPGYEYIFKEPFEPALELTKGGVVESGVYVQRKVASSLAPLDPGTPETDNLVYHVLRVPEYRTEGVLIRFLEAAFAPMTTPEQMRIHGPSKLKLYAPDIIRKRARKVLARIARYGEAAVPKNTLDLVTWSELSPDELARPLESALMDSARAGRKARRTTRHFKNCKQCDVRFLAKRADQDFHSAKCGLRWRRTHPDDRRNCTASPGAIENIGDKQGVFVVPPVMAVSGMEQVSGQNS